MSRRSFLAVCPGLALVCVASLEVRAESIPLKTNTIYVDYSVAGSASQSTSTGQSGWFVYDLWLSGGSQIRDLAGPETTFITVFDFNGLIGSPTVILSSAVLAEGFTASVSTPALGVTPVGVTPAADLAGVPNITINFVNTNASKVFTAVGGEVNIGRLVARSAFTDSQFVTHSASSFDYRVDRSGVLGSVHSLTNTVLPVAPVVVPMPTAAWGGLGLFGVLAGWKLRRRLSETNQESA